MSDPTDRTGEGTPPVGDDRGADGDGPNDEDDRSDEDEGTLEDLLLAEGILEETRDGADVRLTDAFERAWHERIEQMRGGNRAMRWLAASEGVDPDELAVADEGDRFVVRHDGSPVGAWHSKAGFLAGIVAEPTVKEFCDAPERLEALSDEARRELSARLCICLERCPACGADLAFAEAANDDGGVDVSLDCEGCGATVAGGSFE